MEKEQQMSLKRQGNQVSLISIMSESCNQEDIKPSKVFISDNDNLHSNLNNQPVNFSFPNFSSSFILPTIIVCDDSPQDNLKLPTDTQHLPNDKPVKIKNKKQAKPTKKLYSCQVCQNKGKKKEFIKCKICKRFWHADCFYTKDKDQKKKIICHQCLSEKQLKKKELKQLRKKKKMHNKQYKNLKEQDSDNPQSNQLPAKKKTEKEIKKELLKKQLDQFAIRYPYYVNKRKILYPIQDTLFLQMKIIFEGLVKQKPMGHKVKYQLNYSELMLVQNFFMTFKDELQIELEINSQFLQILLVTKFNKMNRQIITLNEMIVSIVEIYLKDILEKNKTENVKMMNENYFFSLICLIKNQEYYKQLMYKIWPEVCLYMSNIPSMTKSVNIFYQFQSTKFLSHLKTIANQGIDSFINMMPEVKLQILSNLIEGLYEVDSFHQIVAKKSDKMQNDKKRKNILQNQMYQSVSSKLEQNNIAEKQQMLVINRKNEVELDMKARTQQQKEESSKILKELDNLKKQSTKLENLIKQTYKRKQSIQQQLQQLQINIPFIITGVWNIGNDVMRAQYFFNYFQKNKIFFLNKNIQVGQQNSWLYYQNQEIEKFKDSLNTNGIRERNLKQNIQNYLKTKRIQYKTFQQTQNNKDLFENIISEFSNKIKRSSVKLIECDYKIMIEEQIACSQKLTQICSILKKMHDQFLFVQFLKDKKRKQGSQKQEDNIIKRKPIRLWLICSQKIKRQFIQYLQNCETLIGLYFCIIIFGQVVRKYIMKKQQQKEQEKVQEDQLVENIKQKLKQEEDKYLRRSYRNSKKLLDTLNQDEDQQSNSQQNNQQKCYICKDYGDMICCDTCPKVFHLQCLKMKQIPKGEWNCFYCHKRLSLEIKTRSRGRLMRCNQI